MDFYQRTIQPALDSRWRLQAGARLDALLKVHRRQPALDQLPPITIIAPTERWFGISSRFDNVSGATIFLSPLLEFEEQSRVEYIVAHEIAHVVLGHFLRTVDPRVEALPHDDRVHERAADALVAAWGFVRPVGLSNVAAWRTLTAA